MYIEASDITGPFGKHNVIQILLQHKRVLCQYNITFLEQRSISGEEILQKSEMAATMKGLLKGLRYISQIFDDSDQEDEQEMQIGHPTNVKHVAHIGLDGPSANSPSWMNEFSSNTPKSPEASNNNNQIATPPTRTPQDGSRSSGGKAQGRGDIPKPTKSSTSHGAPVGATQEHPVIAKHSRRRHSAGGSSSQELADDDTKKTTRRHNKNLSDGVEVNLQDSPMIPKHTRKKKSSKDKEKDSSGNNHRSRLKGSRPSPVDGDGGGAVDGFGG
ncbi:hypothetical protein Scep_013565 [Stephania cephalantha]|uniref:CRIB domain-containing protein n=1 Tax=Stephania cephalantha TaxID=152367 RepID=A0AAP0JHK1_9MAGN